MKFQKPYFTLVKVKFGSLEIGDKFLNKRRKIFYKASDNKAISMVDNTSHYFSEQEMVIVSRRRKEHIDNENYC
jgi:hypothetical protein